MEMQIHIPSCDQYAIALSAWQHRACAICSLWMLLKWHDNNLEITPEELLRKGLAESAYIEGTGWKHSGIVSLAHTFGLELEFAKKFFTTPEDKKIGLGLIDNSLRSGKPVLISIYSHLTPTRGGHMPVIVGYTEVDETIDTYIIQDPDGTFRGHTYELGRDELLANWRGGLIWVK